MTVAKIIDIYLIVYVAILTVGSIIAGIRVVLVKNSDPMTTIGCAASGGLLWPLFVICGPLAGLGTFIGYGIVAWRICRENKAMEKQDGIERGAETTTSWEKENTDENGIGSACHHD